MKSDLRDMLDKFAESNYRRTCLRHIILDAKHYAQTMTEADADVVFCITRGSVIARHKDDSTKGYDCWFELIAYWDAKQQSGRLKFVPLLSGYLFGDTSISEDFLRELIDFHIDYGMDTVSFEGTRQLPRRLKLGHQVIKQVCAIPGAKYTRGYPCKLVKMGNEVKLIDEFEQLYKSQQESFSTSSTQTSCSYCSQNALRWVYECDVGYIKDSRSYQEIISGSLYNYFYFVPTLWLPAPKKGHLMLSLISKDGWQQEADIARTTYGNCCIDYIQSDHYGEICSCLSLMRLEQAIMI